MEVTDRRSYIFYQFLTFLYHHLQYKIYVNKYNWVATMLPGFYNIDYITSDLKMVFSYNIISRGVLYLLVCKQSAT